MVDLAGAWLGLLSMKEGGAVVLLKSIDCEGEASGALSLLAKNFGPYVVIPTLKQYEDPASTKKEKKGSINKSFKIVEKRFKISKQLMQILRNTVKRRFNV